jgi:ABC-2 type transport system permease protein
VRAALNQIGALARRDAVIELSYHFQLMIGLFGTLMGVLTFFFIGRLVGDAEQLARFEGGYFEFALIGLLVMGYSQVCITAFGRSIEAAQAAGTFEILLATRTRLPTLMAGTLIVPLLLASLQAAVYLFFGWVLVGFAVPIDALALTLLLLVLTLGTFASVGILAAAVIVLTKRGDPFSSIALQVSNLLAGALFPITVLPDWLQVVSRFVPAFYGLRGLREVLLAGGGLPEIAIDLAALVAFNAVLLPIALLAISRAVDLARVTGTLGNR